MADCSPISKLMCEEIDGLGEHNGSLNPGNESLTIIREDEELQLISTSEESSCCSLQECSMCGDVGLAQHLFKCLTCSHRYQHTYCSRYYPHKLMGAEAFICNWCLPSEGLLETHDINNHKPERELSKRAPLQASEDHEKLQVKKHTKAFEYLLQIAECHHSIAPGVKNNTEENKQTVGHHQEAAVDCTEIKKSFALRGLNVAQRAHRHRHHNSTDHQDIVAQERIHTLNKSSSSLSRIWNKQTSKREPHLCPPRAVNRRYKLLADVLC